MNAGLRLAVPFWLALLACPLLTCCHGTHKDYVPYPIYAENPQRKTRTQDMGIDSSGRISSISKGETLKTTNTFKTKISNNSQTETLDTIDILKTEISDKISNISKTETMGTTGISKTKISNNTPRNILGTKDALTKTPKISNSERKMLQTKGFLPAISKSISTQHLQQASGGGKGYLPNEGVTRKPRKHPVKRKAQRDFVVPGQGQSLTYTSPLGLPGLGGSFGLGSSLGIPGNLGFGIGLGNGLSSGILPEISLPAAGQPLLPFSPSGANLGSLGFGQVPSFSGRGFGRELYPELSGNANSFGRPRLPPVSSVLKDATGAFLPPGSRARSNGFGFGHTAFEASINEPNLSPVTFQKKDRLKQLAKEVERELDINDKQLTPQQKQTKVIYESIEGIYHEVPSTTPTQGLNIIHSTSPKLATQETGHLEKTEKQNVGPEQIVNGNTGHLNFQAGGDIQSSPSSPAITHTTSSDISDNEKYAHKIVTEAMSSIEGDSAGVSFLLKTQNIPQVKPTLPSIKVENVLQSSIHPQLPPSDTATVFPPTEIIEPFKEEKVNSNSASRGDDLQQDFSSTSKMNDIIVTSGQLTSPNSIIFQMSESPRVLLGNTSKQPLIKFEKRPVPLARPRLKNLPQSVRDHPFETNRGRPSPIGIPATEKHITRLIKPTLVQRPNPAGSLKEKDRLSQDVASSGHRPTPANNSHTLLDNFHPFLHSIGPPSEDKHLHPSKFSGSHTKLPTSSLSITEDYNSTDESRISIISNGNLKPHFSNKSPNNYHVTTTNPNTGYHQDNNRPVLDEISKSLSSQLKNTNHRDLVLQLSATDSKNVPEVTSETRTNYSLRLLPPPFTKELPKLLPSKEILSVTEHESLSVKLTHNFDTESSAKPITVEHPDKSLLTPQKSERFPPLSRDDERNRLQENKYSIPHLELILEPPPVNESSTTVSIISNPVTFRSSLDTNISDAFSKISPSHRRAITELKNVQKETGNVTNSNADTDLEVEINNKGNTGLQLNKHTQLQTTSDSDGGNKQETRKVTIEDHQVWNSAVVNKHNSFRTKQPLFRENVEATTFKTQRKFSSSLDFGDAVLDYTANDTVEESSSTQKSPSANYQANVYNLPYLPVPNSRLRNNQSTRNYTSNSKSSSASLHKQRRPNSLKSGPRSLIRLALQRRQSSPNTSHSDKEIMTNKDRMTRLGQLHVKGTNRPTRTQSRFRINISERLRLSNLPLLTTNAKNGRRAYGKIQDQNSPTQEQENNSSLIYVRPIVVTQNAENKQIKVLSSTPGLDPGQNTSIPLLKHEFLSKETERFHHISPILESTSSLPSSQPSEQISKQVSPSSSDLFSMQSHTTVSTRDFPIDQILLPSVIAYKTVRSNLPQVTSSQLKADGYTKITYRIKEEIGFKESTTYQFPIPSTTQFTTLPTTVSPAQLSSEFKSEPLRRYSSTETMPPLDQSKTPLIPLSVQLQATVSQGKYIPFANPSTSIDTVTEKTVTTETSVESPITEIDPESVTSLLQSASTSTTMEPISFSALLPPSLPSQETIIFSELLLPQETSLSSDHTETSTIIAASGAPESSTSLNSISYPFATTLTTPSSTDESDGKVTHLDTYLQKSSTNYMPLQKSTFSPLIRQIQLNASSDSLVPLAKSKTVSLSGLLAKWLNPPPFSQSSAHSTNGHSPALSDTTARHTKLNLHDKITTNPVRVTVSILSLWKENLTSPIDATLKSILKYTTQTSNSEHSLITDFPPIVTSSSPLQTGQSVKQSKETLLDSAVTEHSIISQFTDKSTVLPSTARTVSNSGVEQAKTILQYTQNTTYPNENHHHTTSPAFQTLSTTAPVPHQTETLHVKEHRHQQVTEEIPHSQDMAQVRHNTTEPTSHLEVNINQPVPLVTHHLSHETTEAEKEPFEPLVRSTRNLNAYASDVTLPSQQFQSNSLPSIKQSSHLMLLPYSSKNKSTELSQYLTTQLSQYLQATKHINKELHHLKAHSQITTAQQRANGIHGAQQSTEPYHHHSTFSSSKHLPPAPHETDTQLLATQMTTKTHFRQPNPPTQDSKHTSLQNPYKQQQNAQDSLHPQSQPTTRLDQGLHQWTGQRSRPELRQSSSQASSPVQRETSSPVQGETSSTVQRETSSTVQREISSQVQREISSPVSKETSSPVQRETSSPVQRETSSTVQSEHIRRRKVGPFVRRPFIKRLQPKDVSKTSTTIKIPTIPNRVRTLPSAEERRKIIRLAGFRNNVRGRL